MRFVRRAGIYVRQPRQSHTQKNGSPQGEPSLVMVFSVGLVAERGCFRAYSVSPSQPSLLLVKVREATELLRPFFRAMAFTVVVAFSVMGAL